jgi:hypothetical protein
MDRDVRELKFRIRESTGIQVFGFEVAISIFRPAGSSLTCETSDNPSE